jgi:hypothetical protein
MNNGLDESIVVWERLAETGSSNKRQAIRDLYADGSLPRYNYMTGCPLCEHVNGDCAKCVWPYRKSRFQGSRCTYHGPYYMWKRSDIPAQFNASLLRSAWAKHVVGMLKGVRRKLQDQKRMDV